MAAMAASLFANAISVSFVLILLAVVAVRWLDGSWIRVIRSLRLLSWFIVPIIMLHALFSHGQLLWPWQPLPVTYEGLFAGVRLALHFVSIFFAAMLLFRMLSGAQWLYWFRYAPGSESIMPYLMLLLPLRRHMMLQLQRLREQWRLRKQWRQLHRLLLAACVSALRLSRQQADGQWLRWSWYRVDTQQLEWQAASTAAVLIGSLLLGGFAIWLAM